MSGRLSPTAKSGGKALKRQLTHFPQRLYFVSRYNRRRNDWHRRGRKRRGRPHGLPATAYCPHLPFRRSPCNQKLARSSADVRLRPTLYNSRPMAQSFPADLQRVRQWWNFRTLGLHYCRLLFDSPRDRRQAAIAKALCGRPRLDHNRLFMPFHA